MALGPDLLHRTGFERSIPPMGRPPVAGATLVVALALVCSVVVASLALGATPTATSGLHRASSSILILDQDGEISVRRAGRAGAAPLNRLAPIPHPRSPPRRPVGGGRPHAAAAGRRRTVRAELHRMLAAGALSVHDYHERVTENAAARSTLKRLSGTRYLELAAVIANLDDIAARGLLIVSRVPALFETLDRNRQWWSTGPLLTDGQRVGFPASRLVWEYYPGQGIEIQWLATFGAANGLFAAHRDRELGELLGEVVPLASERAGGLAWEYEFRFDGGRPPWVSGLAQGTAVQALARGAQELRQSSFADVGRRALAVFSAPPPAGVRVATSAGAHYLIYSFAPSERVLNGFIQALVGLHDFSSLTGDAGARSLFTAGDAEARLEVSHYDTGAWSLYDQSTESDLSYHELLRDFLSHLCDRLTADSTSAGTTPGPPASPSAGADEIYCATAARFTSYLHTAPVLSLLTTTVHARTHSHIRLTVSKISVVAVTVRGPQGVTRLSYQGKLAHGTHTLTWSTPRQTGSYGVDLSATDLAGNQAQARATINVRGRARP